MLYKDKRPLLIFLLPAFLFMIVFLYYPFIKNISNSLFDLSGLVQFEAPPFIGLENYKTLFTDPKIKVSLINTFKMMGLTIVFQVGIALILALMVDSIKIGQQFFRTVYFFPIVISATAIGLMFNLFYNYNGGMLNQILAEFSREPVMWLSQEKAFLMVSIPILWQYIGFYFIILLTGLNNIPGDIYEAAEIDGCSGFKKVIYIKIPLIRNVIGTCLVLAITGALKVFDLPWVIAPHGAPSGITHFTGTYMYETTFAIGNVDYGSTIALMIVVLGVVVSQAVNKIFKQLEI
jgi:raffinose/stachyose/melibiose transport system permease protein